MPKRKRRREEPRKPPEPDLANRLTGIIEFSERHATALLVVFLLIATARIISTWFVYNHTSYEPAHIGCGMEWLDKGTYKLEPQHPPLARVAAALGPYLAGKRSQGRDWMYQEGIAILYSGNQYDQTLALARLGILPFFWLAGVGRFSGAGAISERSPPSCRRSCSHRRRQCSPTPVWPPRTWR